MLYEFLEHVQNEAIHKFTETLEIVYSRIIQQLEQEFPDLKKYCKEQNKEIFLQDDSKKGVAGQLYKFFPTHFFKFFQSLIITEMDSIKTTRETSVLAWSSITFVDIGCGAGAGSIALLFLLERYQQFLIDNHKPISPIRVFLIGFDPSENMIFLYRRFLEQYVPRLSPLLSMLDIRL